MEKFLTISQAAELLSVTIQTIRMLDKAGKIKTVRTPGNQRRIPQSEIRRLLRISDDDIFDTYASITLEIPPKETVNEDEKSYSRPFLLMCKDVTVYDIIKSIVHEESLLPGCMKMGTMDYSGWMKTRYSAGSNTSARRLMLRAFGSDNHENTLEVIRGLSLSDCYWLKQQNEAISFNDITPYLHEEWDGTGIFTGGSISTIFVNGAADKRWLDSETLLKVNSYGEYEPYELCSALGLNHATGAEQSDDGIRLTNFTSTDFFFESMEQSGFVKYNENPREKAVEIFKELAVALFVIDYLVEHDDRHWGNYGFIRSTNTGEYISMAPYFDFDWAWSGGVAPLPDAAFLSYGEFIYDLCKRARRIAESFKHGETIATRADELLNILKT